MLRKTMKICLLSANCRSYAGYGIGQLSAHRVLILKGVLSVQVEW